MANQIKVGWGVADITPEKPVFLAGQFPARVSEGILDRTYANALALQNDDYVVMVSCDVVRISAQLLNAVRQELQRKLPEIDPQKVIINATHTHTAPENIPINPENGGMAAAGAGVDVAELGVTPVTEYLEFAAARIVEAISAAWNSRAPGGIAYGSGYAVLGRNRRWVDRDGVAMMYGLNEESAERFQHIEGYEDHSVNLLATYDAKKNLTGIVFNAPMTAQETGMLFEISADIWHEARQELRKRYGEDLKVLSQVSAAGELTPKRLYDKSSDERMLQLKGRTMRQEMAFRIANAVDDILPYLPQAIETNPRLEHHINTAELPMNALTEEHVKEAETEMAKLQKIYEEELQKVKDNPSLKKEQRWYVPISKAWRRKNWYKSVVVRYEQMKTQPRYSAEIHTIRLGDIVFATNPFELYLDFGVQIKLRSPATQTFLVELCNGSGGYVPSARSTKGGGYGSMPASNRVGPEGGQVLTDETVKLIRKLWK